MAGKAEVVDRVAELTGYPKTQVAMTYDLLFELMSEELAGGDKITVPNFGTFQISERPARLGRNPATGEQIEISASKSVRFKVSKNLKEHRSPGLRRRRCTAPGGVFTASDAPYCPVATPASDGDSPPFADRESARPRAAWLPGPHRRSTAT